MIAGLGRRIPIGAWLVFWLLCGGAPSFAQAPDGGLRAEVEALAGAGEFAVSGLDQIVGPVPATPPKESMADRRLSKTFRRLKSLLQSYDFVLLNEAQGRIAELRLAGAQTSRNAAPKRYAVPGWSAGGFQGVTVELSGPNDRPMTLPFIVDARASTITLSASHIEPLGFLAEDLEDGVIETSDGRIPVKLGRLDFLQVGPVTAQGVAVAFIDQEATSRMQSLGMHVLSRFGVILESGSEGLEFISK